MAPAIGRLLKRTRQVRALSATEVARSAGISAAYLSKLESDAVKRPVDTDHETLQLREEELQARAWIVLAQIEYVRGHVVQAQHLLIAWQTRRIQASPTPLSDQLSRDVQAALARIQLATGDFVAVKV